MRYAVISDLHANRQAVKAVLNDISSSAVDRIICLGDIVGYGPCPAEVLESAYANIHYFVLGNHDAVVCGKLSSQYFNDNAKKLIEWTRASLDKKASKFFNGLPLVIKGEGFRSAHGEFSSPGRFGYILEPDEAIAAFRICSEQVLFVGHSHVPGLFVLGNSGTAHWLEPTDFGLEDEKRYIVNAGSVGQPRDNDTRASYCIFDTDKRNILFRKIPFDIDAYREDLKRKKLPESSSYFLDIHQKRAPRPIRDIIDFGVVREENTVKTDVDVVDLEKTVRKLKRTRTNLLIALLGLFIGIIFVSSFYLMKKNEADRAKTEAEKASLKLSEVGKEVKKYRKTVYESLKTYSGQIPPQINAELISIPDGWEGIVSAATLLDSWTVILTDPETQKVAIEKFGDKTAGIMPAFRISSGVSCEIILRSISIPAEKGMRFTASAQFKKEKLNSGYIELIIEEELPDGTRKQLEHNIPDEITKSDKWTRRTSVTLKKTEPLKENCKICLLIRGQFSGEILVRKCSLKRIE